MCGAKVVSSPKRHGSGSSWACGGCRRRRVRFGARRAVWGIFPRGCNGHGVGQDQPCPTSSGSDLANETGGRNDSTRARHPVAEQRTSAPPPWATNRLAASLRLFRQRLFPRGATQAGHGWEAAGGFPAEPRPRGAGMGPCPHLGPRSATSGFPRPGRGSLSLHPAPRVLAGGRQPHR